MIREGQIGIVHQKISDTFALLKALTDAGIGSIGNERLAILFLYQHGASTLGNIHNSIHISRAAMTTLADRLSDAGLVQRTHTTDRRKRLIELTTSAVIRLDTAFGVGEDFDVAADLGIA